MASRLDPPAPSLRDALRGGNIFGGAVQNDLNQGMQSTWGNLRAGFPPAPGPAPAPAALPLGVGGGFMGGRPALNEATGNGIFGLPLPKTEQQNIQGLSGPVQIAGLLNGASQQGQMADYSQRLQAAGINPFDPSGQSPGQFQQGVTAAQGIYNNVFATPGTGGAKPSDFTGLPQGVPVSTYAPTDFRQQTIDASGGPFSQPGGPTATATKNAQGGYAFTLTQNPATTPAPGAAPVPGALAPAPAPASATAGVNPFQQNSATFNSAITSPQAAIQAAFAPGVTDPLRAYVAAAKGHVDKDMLKTVSDITLKHQAAADKKQSNDALKTAYAPDVAPEKSAASPSAPAAGGATADLESAKAHLSNAIAGGLTDHTVISKLSANVESAKKKVEQEKSHTAILSQINQQNDALMDHITQALPLTSHAGPIEGHMVGRPGGTGVTQLHALINSIGSNEMMDYIQRMKVASPLGSTGIGRILDREADAMTNTLAALKDPQLPAERLDPKFLSEQLSNLMFRSTRLNLAANGINPDSRTFATPGEAEAAAKAGKIAPGDKVIVGKRPAIWK